MKTTKRKKKKNQHIGHIYRLIFCSERILSETSSKRRRSVPYYLRSADAPQVNKKEGALKHDDEERTLLTRTRVMETKK